MTKIDFGHQGDFYGHSIAIPASIPDLLNDYNCRYVCDFDFGLARMGIKGIEYFDDFGSGHNHFKLYGCQWGGVTVFWDMQTCMMRLLILMGICL